MRGSPPLGPMLASGGDCVSPAQSTLVREVNVAQLWTKPNGVWKAHELEAPCYALSWNEGAAEPAIVEWRENTGFSGDALLIRSDGALPGWLLIGRGLGLRQINGKPIVGGLAHLQDRTELSWPGRGRAYFSEYSPARVVRLPDGVAGPDGAPIRCPRCGDVIGKSDPAVQCPGCRLWYHAGDDFPCYTLGLDCVACAHPTTLDSERSWSPEDE